MNLIFVSDVFIIVTSLIVLVVASITDIKKREVANWLVFSFLAVMLALRVLIWILTGSWAYFVYALIYGVVAFIIASLLYYGKALGGADAKLLIGLACAFATAPSFLNFNYSIYLLGISSFFTKNLFIFDFIVNCLFVGLVYSLVYSFVLAFLNKERFVKTFSEISKQKKTLRIVFLVLGLVLLVMAFYNQINQILLVLGVFVLIFPYLYIFVRSVENSCLIKMKSWKELTEGDWLVKSVKINKKIINPSADGLSKEDIRLIKKSGKTVLIKDGLPFVPVFLISLVVSLLLGNLLIRILEILV